MRFQLSNKYSRLRMFLLISVLVGVTLCLVQVLGIFSRFDALLLSHDPETTYSPLPLSVMILIIMFHTMLPGLITLEEGVVKGVVYTVVIWFFYSVLIHSYTTSLSYYIPLIAPLLGCIISTIRVLGWEYTLLLQEKDGLKKTFGSFVEPRVADIVLSNPDLFNQDGVRTSATIMFADFRGFTKLCEVLDPEQIITILRDCFGKLISIAKANGGTVDKLIGDCMMVVWGNPVPIENHAEKAVEAAIEMQSVMGSLKKKWERRLGVEILLGIGIATDDVVAGTTGSEEFCDYTVLGSGVNLAATLEAHCPGDAIYVSDKTYEILSESFNFITSEKFQVKNNGGTVTAHQVVL